MHGILEQDTMFSVKEKPWHGLGTVVETAPSIKEAIKLAGLDWTVSVKPLQTADGSAIPVNSHRCVVKDTTNDVLGIVGNQYSIIQNSEAFDWFEPLLEAGLIKLETAGSLFNGRKIFILANTKMENEVVEGDKVESYLLFSNAHDGRSAVQIGFTPIRVVCNNTLTAAQNNKLSQLIKIKHTSTVKANLEDLRNIMDITNSQFIASIEQYKELAKKDISQADLHKYVKRVFSAQSVENIINDYEKEKEDIENFRKRLMGRIDEIFELEPAHKVWNAYNAVNSYLNHEKTKDLDKRYDAIWFGYNKRTDKKAYELALQL